MVRERDQDACPGALQVHQAADGALVRVRLPGGLLRADQLEALAHTAAEHGSGTLELTSRGSVQLRGITDPAAVADAIAGAGLLPSPTHERARNIVSSPLSGRVGGMVDVRDWISELDAAVCADPVLAGLPGRFWFGLDDGRGDVSGLRADVGVHAVDSDTVALLFAGVDTGVRLDLDDVIATLLAVARRFVAVRDKNWRITELDDPRVLLGDLAPSAEPGRSWPPSTRGPIGWLPQDDGRIALGAGVQLGVLPSRTAEYLAAIGAPIVVTPWRSVLVCDLSEEIADVSLRVLAPQGLIFDENSPWLDISACVGSPGCEKSAADVRADAAAAAETGEHLHQHRHFVGCDRACGSPQTGEVLVATGDGYRTRNAHA
ncbi:precorrin-3B synthase [Mycolicibacterium tokaiense]|uniref:Cobalamin biosynthesis protein n=1 Tax=Mycolicibacterium tokaiense TaxID=39695 RepID=A0A378TNC3_9MYCO|nr:precorrin-3B synthase [Mycolicibacterium tokaiense]BBY89548.1 precorrin-3B synthase [Mycolicibacterium tokaiense]STZ62064.1 cobalamin biosynthesis protein [Mycolicibacterium tokaiense]